MIYLRDFADILRCQVPRKRISREEAAAMAAVAEEIENNGNDGGMQIVREIGLDDFFFPSYIVDVDKAADVRLKLGSRSMKFLLQEDDILLIASGLKSRLGSLRIMGWTPDEDTIAGGNFVVIRSRGEIDPVWLYYNLHDTDLKSHLIASATGETKNLKIPMETLRSLAFEKPVAEDVDTINKCHAVLKEKILEEKACRETSRNEIHVIQMLMDCRKQIRTINGWCLYEPEVTKE